MSKSNVVSDMMRYDEIKHLPVYVTCLICKPQQEMIPDVIDVTDAIYDKKKLKRNMKFIIQQYSTHVVKNIEKIL